MKRLQCKLLLMILLLGCGGDRGIPRRGIVAIVPIGPVSMDVLIDLQRDLAAGVSRDVVIAAELPRPEAAFDVSRKQYRGSALLDELARHDIPAADRVVGIIDADSYAPGLNFIFGQAKKPGRFAIVALPRFRDSFRGRPENAVRFRSRLLKETVHEIGHTFGFEHCPDRTCVMYFSNSFADTDYKSSQFCRREKLPQ